MKLSFVIATHNPHRERLRRTLAGLARQTLTAGDWEAIVIDNASSDFPDPAFFRGLPARVVREPELGLTPARRRGLRESAGAIIVLVDDDNVLAPDYGAQAAAIFARHASLGAAGGRSLAEYERAPAGWETEFVPLLAIRDPGDAERIARGSRPGDPVAAPYPDFAPIGAGMVLRRAAVEAWFSGGSDRSLPDRKGGELSSAGDNDIVLSILHAGWDVGYFPSLSLVHLIPAQRLEAAYLARLNRGIQSSWMRVLSKHEVNPWPPIPRWTLPLREARAWFSFRPWTGPAARIRWHGARGHFEGRTR